MGVTSLQRFGGLPEVSTIAESAFPGFESIEWYGIAAPARVPRAAYDKLSADIQSVLKIGN